jgi:hypothetical protein
MKKIKLRTSKRKGSDEDDDDDDGLANEYDYSDSFIDDDELQDSARVDRTGILFIPSYFLKINFDCRRFSNRS